MASPVGWIVTLVIVGALAFTMVAAGTSTAEKIRYLVSSTVIAVLLGFALNVLDGAG